jgi:hypothetical protein
MDLQSGSLKKSYSLAAGARMKAQLNRRMDDKQETGMNIWTILLIVLIVVAVGGGFGGYYPRNYGFGGGGLLLVILIVLLLGGRL